MTNAVHLTDVRCDGRAHGGCQAGCLIFWKDAWLERVNDEAESLSRFEIAKAQLNEKQCGTLSGCTEREVWAGTLASRDETDPAEVTYVCQSTNLAKATHPLYWWDPRQYMEDYTSGNVRLSQILATFLFFIYSTIARGGSVWGLPCAGRTIVFRNSVEESCIPYVWVRFQRERRHRRPA